MTVALQTVIEELKVHGVNPKGNPKYKSAGGLNLGGNIWVNVAEGVDMAGFKFNHINKVKRIINENGKRGNVVELISVGERFDQGITSSTLSTGASVTRKFVDNSKGQRLGGLGHDIAEVASAIVVANGLNFDQFVELYPKVRDFLTNQRNEMEKVDK